MISTENSLFKGLFKLVKSTTLVKSASHTFLANPFAAGLKTRSSKCRKFGNLSTDNSIFIQNIYLSLKNIIYRKCQKLYIFAKLNGLKLHIASYFF